MLVENHPFEFTPEPIPSLFGAPVGVTPLEFCRDLWRQKTEVPELSYDIVCVVLHLAVLVQCRLVTDGQTDTRRRHIPR